MTANARHGGRPPPAHAAWETSERAHAASAFVCLALGASLLTSCGEPCRHEVFVGAAERNLDLSPFSITYVVDPRMELAMSTLSPALVADLQRRLEPDRDGDGRIDGYPWLDGVEVRVLSAGQGDEPGCGTLEPVACEGMAAAQSFTTWPAGQLDAAALQCALTAAAALRCRFRSPSKTLHDLNLASSPPSEVVVVTTGPDHQADERWYERYELGFDVLFIGPVPPELIDAEGALRPGATSDPRLVGTEVACESPFGDLGPIRAVPESGLGRSLRFESLCDGELGTEGSWLFLERSPYTVGFNFVPRDVRDRWTSALRCEAFVTGRPECTFPGAVSPLVLEDGTHACALEELAAPVHPRRTGYLDEGDRFRIQLDTDLDDVAMGIHCTDVCDAPADPHTRGG